MKSSPCLGDETEWTQTHKQNGGGRRPVSLVGAVRTRVCDTCLDRSIWWPPLCLQTCVRWGLAWLSDSPQRTHTPQRSARQTVGETWRIQVSSQDVLPGCTTTDGFNVTCTFILRMQLAHLPAAGDFHTFDGPGDLDGADTAVLAALLFDVLKDLLVVLIVHQLLGHHHVEEAQHLRGHAGVLQPLESRDLQHDRRLYDGGLQVQTHQGGMSQSN